MTDEQISELAQKLYEEEGHAGNVYKTEAHILRRYENMAVEKSEISALFAPLIDKAREEPVFCSIVIQI